MGTKIVIDPTHECATCNAGIQLAGGLWIDASTRFACGENGRHAPAVEPVKTRAVWDNGVPIVQQLDAQHQKNLQRITAQAQRAQAARESLGLGVFDPLAGYQMLEGCTVGWMDADGTREAQGCMVAVYGAAATVTTPEGVRFYDRLSSKTFNIIRG